MTDAQPDPRRDAETLRRALRADPLNARTRLALAHALQRAGAREAATDAYLAVLGLAPESVPALNNLGNLLAGGGRRAEAARFFGRAVAAAPDHANANLMLGICLMESGQAEEALPPLHRALELGGGTGPALAALGFACRRLWRLGEAEDWLRRALAQKLPAAQAAEAAAALAAVMQAQGRTGEAVTLLRPVVAQLQGRSGAALHSGLILGMLYDPATTPDAVRAEAQAWAARFDGVRPMAPPPNRRAPDKRLRIAYLAADFRTHPVGFFAEPLVAGHDRNAVEVTCIHVGSGLDAVGQRIKAAADRWVAAPGIGDGDLAHLVRRLDIDVLVEMAGHTGANRLGALALRPAPVQMCAGGHVGTTGFGPGVLDALVVDALHVRPGEEDRFSEPLAPLPGGYVAWQPPAAAPEVAPPPSASGRPLTFGCFNNPAKLSNRAAALWGRVLAAVPDARLLLRSRGLDDQAAARHLRARFAEHGISGPRLVLQGGAPGAAQFMAGYADVDIALDPQPYSGGVTTLEALWMGVPVIAMAGSLFTGRHAAAHLTHAGLGELVAADADDYVALAAGLAGDPDRLAGLRGTLRARLAASPLCDGVRHARHVEETMRRLWHRCCASTP